MCQKEKIRIVLADDSGVIRRELSKAVARMRFILVGQAQDGEEAIEMVERTNPDLLVLDVEMPRMDGITTTRILRKREHPVRILILSNYADREFVKQLIELGINGYMVKGEAPLELEGAICTIVEQEKNWFSKFLT